MQCVAFTSLMMLQIIHGQSINTKSHDIIFETLSIWLKLNSGRTIPLSFRGQLGPGAFRPSPALVAPWTRAVSFSPRSISTKYSSAKSQKPLGCASRFLRLSRGFWVHILLVSKITLCDFIYYTSPVDYLVQKHHFAQTILKPKSSAEIFKITCRWFWKSKIAWGHFKSFWQIFYFFQIYLSIISDCTTTASLFSLLCSIIM